MSLGPAFKGVRLLDGEMTSVDIWQLIHSNAREWLQVPRNSNFFKIREMLDEADREALTKLSRLDPDIWEHLCYGAEWTVLGAVGLSWCREANFNDVAARWQSVTPMLAADEMTLRAASLLNPTLLSSARSLNQICSDVGFDPFRIALTLAARSGPIEIDLSKGQLLAAPASLVPVLTHVMRRIGKQGSYQEVINHWETRTAHQQI